MSHEAAAPRDRRFYAAMATIIAALVFAGFTPSFYTRSSGLEPLPAPVVVHGVAGTLFVLVFAVQSWLIAVGREGAHRKLGVGGAALAAAFVISGVAVTVRLEESHAFDTTRVLAAHVWTNAAPLAAFALLVAAGIWQRHVAARHKRLMLLAAVVLLPPATGRLFGPLELAWLNLPLYVCAAAASSVYDVVTRGRPHALSVFPAAALVAIDVTTTWWLSAVGS
ncbi:MAG TPA: hypothetical protein VM692_03195 [Gammaproteobacteria bacterium]|nr:hypothetical protein [Gammaproteobacteria bacterium]